MTLKNEQKHNEAERYHFTWVGKSQAKKSVNDKPKGKLTLDAASSIDYKKSKNIFVEGENSEVLKLLLTKYTNSIKLIYIDPPYNTGNSNFMYEDSYKESKSKRKVKLDTIQEQVATEQQQPIFEQELERYHSLWLSMMYTRLLLASKFLAQDGVILISIDDGEVAHLKLICDEIFGMQNFIGNFIWQNRTTPNDAGLKFATDHEYVVAYAKDKSKVKFIGIEKDLSNYKNLDNDKHGDWIADNPSAASGNESYRFPITNPFTGQIYYPPKGRYWAFSPKRIEEWTKSGKLVFPKDSNKNFVLKKYKSELKSLNKPISSVIQGILTSFGTKELKELFQDACPFKYPKPTQLIKLFVKQLTSKNDIILDFFAGSGTTAQAVIEANLEDENNRSFICIQQPEKYASKDADMNAQYKTISEVTKLRIRKVIEKYKKDKLNQNHACLNVRVFSHTPST